MKTASAKAKGRALQVWTAAQIRDQFPELTEDDVRSTSSGANGADVLLSAAAKRLFPYKVEAKNQERFRGLYTVFEQAESHKGPETPLLVVKSNRKTPLVILRAEDFFHLIGQLNDKNTTA